MGGGLVGDEVGLLLTFGNYDSVLTLYFFVIVVSLGVFGILLGGYRKELEYDVLSLESRERLAYLGVVAAGLSALPFAAGMPLLGAAILVAGMAVVLAGVSSHRRKTT